MAGNVDSIVLEQLRLIRESLGVVQSKMGELDAKVDDLGIELRGHAALLIGLGSYVKSIDERVEHLEHAIGAQE
jgi:hypothetical protein